MPPALPVSSKRRWRCITKRYRPRFTSKSPTLRSIWKTAPSKSSPSERPGPRGLYHGAGQSVRSVSAVPTYMPFLKKRRPNRPAAPGGRSSSCFSQPNQPLLWTGFASSSQYTWGTTPSQTLPTLPIRSRLAANTSPFAILWWLRMPTQPSGSWPHRGLGQLHSKPSIRQWYSCFRGRARSMSIWGATCTVASRSSGNGWIAASSCSGRSLSANFATCSIRPRGKRRPLVKCSWIPAIRSRRCSRSNFRLPGFG